MLMPPRHAAISPEMLLHFFACHADACSPAALSPDFRFFADTPLLPSLFTISSSHKILRHMLPLSIFAPDADIDDISFFIDATPLLSLIICCFSSMIRHFRCCYADASYD